MNFKQSDGFNADTPLRFTVYDVREKVSSTSVPIGYAEVVLGAIQVREETILILNFDY